MKIIIGGDLCPTKRDENYFKSGDAKLLFGSAIDLLKNSDLTIANLETPLIKKNSPIRKTGAIFHNSVKILNAIKESGINFLNLSNNHIMDHGIGGLETTISAIKDYDLMFGGVGKNSTDASEPVKLNIGGEKIAIISYCEHEFSVSSKIRAGANGLDLIDFLDKMNILKKESYFIILLYHGGKEHYALPSPNQKKICEFFINQGVNIVVCQHSHIGGLISTFQSKKIFYGQGNFLFDPYPIKKEWLYKGFLIDIELKNGKIMDIILHPIYHKSFNSSNQIGIDLMSGLIKKDYLDNLNELIEKISLDPELIEKSWKDLALSNKNLIMSVLNGNGRIMRNINKYIPFLNLKYTENDKLLIKNYINCETHLELMRSLFNDAKD